MVTMPVSERGYTLLELVVVAALVAILLAIGASSVRNALAREEADGWARTLVHELTAAQQAAITRRTSVAATFQDQTFSVAVVGGGTLRREVLPAHLRFGGALLTITFDRRGVPSGASSVTITSTTGRSYTITVEPGTGRVSHRED
jgi:prepilin-type N-terminal cleavage/methylation domain-containing protein